MAGQLGDQDEVVASADEVAGEGVAQDVAGEVVLRPGGVGDGVQDVVGAEGGQAGDVGGATAGTGVAVTDHGQDGVDRERLAIGDGLAAVNTVNVVT